MLVIDADRHCWTANLVVARRCVAQNKVTDWRYSVSGDALFEMLLDPIQIVYSNRWPVLRIGKPETLRELHCSASRTISTSSVMDRYAVENTKPVLIIV